MTDRSNLDATGCGISYVSHVNVVCSDFDRSLHFYRDILGATVAGGNDGVVEDRCEEGLKEPMGFIKGPAAYRGAMLYWGEPNRGSYIDLVQYSEPGRRIDRVGKDYGTARIALRVASVQASKAWLEKHGVEFVGPVISVTIKGRARHIFFVKDPDGTLIQLVERH